MDFWTLVIIVIVVVVAFAIIQIVNTSNKQKAMEDYLRGIPDFTVTQKIMGSDGKSGLAVDERRQRICAVTHAGQAVTARVITYRDVLSSELFDAPRCPLNANV